MTLDETVSPPGRLAGDDEDISEDELRLAARNHGMPLEALRYDATPAGLHYLLIHYDIPYVEPGGWRLHIGGHVDRPVELSLDDVKARPQVNRRVTLECAGNGRATLRPRPVSQPWLDGAVGNAEWTGTPLAPILREVAIRDGAVDVTFTGADHGVERGVEQDYTRGLPLAEALSDDVLLVYAMNGQPLLPQHGAPVRLLVPGWYGMAHVKWLVRIEVLDRAFDGFQNLVSYRIKQDADEPGEPVTRIQPKALIEPPGFPDFATRTRVVDRGTHELRGRAWSGWAPVARVEVSVDGGAAWQDAALDDTAQPYGWQQWRWTWDAPDAGRYDLCARATDHNGNTQPLEPVWNRQGMANNHVQHLPVVVR